MPIIQKSILPPNCVLAPNQGGTGLTLENIAANLIPVTDGADGYLLTSAASLVSSLLDLKGVIGCSTNPNYPAAIVGDSYLVSVAGKIGGGAGLAVIAGDLIVCLVNNAGGTQAAVGNKWFVLQGVASGFLLAANNLSDVASLAAAWANLGAAALPSTIALQASQPAAGLLVNGWADFGVGYVPSGYYKDAQGLVHLEGAVSGGAIPSTIFTLPTGYRSTAGLRAFSTQNNGSTNNVIVQPNGDVIVTASGSALFLSLDGISFRST